MKNKILDYLTCGLFCLLLFGVLALYLILPAETFSEKEKRYLEVAPTLSWENLRGFGGKVEAYLADRIPGRDFFVGVNAYYDLLSGRQVTKNAYLIGSDRMVQVPVAANDKQIEKNMRYINRFAQDVGRQVDLMIVPSAGYILQEDIQGLKDPYTDDAIIQKIYGMAGDGIRTVDLIPTFQADQDPQSLYYRTDHHWTSRGAYTAYAAYMEVTGAKALTQDQFTVEKHGGFYGSVYSGSGLWLTPSEDIELWKTDAPVTVTIDDDRTSDTMFFTSRLQELDKYTVFLDGVYGKVTIHNPQGEGSILVIRDSYASCYATFLAQTYETVVLVDLRYYANGKFGSVVDLAKNGNFTDILVSYSIGNFMTDSNIPKLGVGA